MLAPNPVPRQAPQSAACLGGCQAQAELAKGKPLNFSPLDHGALTLSETQQPKEVLVVLEASSHVNGVIRRRNSESVALEMLRLAVSRPNCFYVGHDSPKSDVKSRQQVVFLSLHTNC